MPNKISECYPQEHVLMQHLDLIYHHLNTILNTPKFYYMQLPHVYFGATPIGKRKVYLGDVLQLWQNSTLWHYTALEVVELSEGWSRGAKKNRANPCGMYILNCVGSALSGSNSALAWDRQQKCLLKIMLPTVGGVFKALEAIKPQRAPNPSTDEAIPKDILILIEQLKSMQ